MLFGDNSLARRSEKSKEFGFTSFPSKVYATIDKNVGTHLYLQNLLSTCSSLYLGEVQSLNRLQEQLDFLIDWAFNDEYANYTELLCTIRTREDDVIHTLKNLGFQPLGDPFKNRRTNHELQHFSLRKGVK